MPENVQEDLSVPKNADLRGLPMEKIKRLIGAAFDRVYYTAKYPGLDYRASDPLEHYCLYGWLEGKDPSDWFSTEKYLLTNPDVAYSGVNPLLHYIMYGRMEGRTISPPERTPAVEEINIGLNDSSTAEEMALLRDHFDEQFYTERYPDMRAPGADPLEHYCVFGWREGRDPCSWFSTRQYLQYNRDVDNSGVNPFYHYIRDGRAEGRPVWPAGYSGPRELAVDRRASLVSDLALRDLIRFPSRKKRFRRQGYDPACLTLDWVVPDFAVGSGGHMTLFRMIRWLELFGHTCRIWISDLTIHSSLSEAYDDIVKYFQTIRAEIRLADDGLAETTGDVVFATGWQTVPRVVNAVGFRERCYLVQDFEPSFYPSGSHYLAAEWTYTQDLACICASPWLANTLSTKFGRWTRQFSLAYDPENYYIADRPDDLDSIPHIAVYGRAATPRRCVEMALLALEHLASAGIQFVADLYGADLDAKASSFPCIAHGILDAKRLGELYRRSVLGVCFSATNYSLVPQEMMACGLPVVEIDGASTRSIFPAGVVTRTGPHPLDISADIRRLLESPARRSTQAAAAHQWIEGLSWERSARAVESAALDRLQEGGHAVRRSPGRRAVFTTAVKPHVSVCVPTLNGGDLLLNVVEKVEAQRCPWSFEIIIVDSGSDDGSIERLSGAPHLRVETIARKDFQHGRTRNYCIEIARGEFVAFLTQDALPLDEFWLYNLVVTLDHFPRSAGAFGRHLAWPSASPFVKRDLEAHFAEFMLHPLSVSRDTDPEKWARGSHSWRQILHFYSDNNSCMRRRIWKDYPYPEIEYGEDHVWASRIIESGFERVYAPEAVVYHSHDYTLGEIENRAATESRFFREFFGYSSYDFAESFEDQLQRRNDSDERWARAHGIVEDALQRRMRENNAQLRGMRSGMLGSGTAG